MNVENERRGSARCEIKRSLNYRMAGDKYIHIAYMRNLGGGGLCFQSSGEVEEGESIDIEFELPESLDRVVASGVVIWCNALRDEWAKTFDVGVCFTRISDENRLKINDFLSKKIRRLSYSTPPEDRDNVEKKTLLIVDGDQETLDAMQTLLEPHYNVLIAYRGSDAIELTLRRSPDVVLVDLMMPDDDGINTLKILKSKENIRSIPVITMSAISLEDRVAEAEKCGAAAFISKPFQIEALNRKISEVIGC